MVSRDTQNKLTVVLVLLVATVGFGIFMALTTDEAPANWTFETLEEKQSDALELIRDRFEPSDYAIERLPAAIAAGEWSSSRNLWNCNNPGETNCFEVDFKMSSVNIECKWLVSYDRVTADVIEYRALNEAASNLFTETAGADHTGRVYYSGEPLYEKNDGSTASDAIRLIRNDYVPKDPAIYSNSQAGWFAVKKNVLSNGDDVIAVYFLESKADTPSEWIVELFPSVHNRYKLIRVNSEVSLDFVPKSTRPLKQPGAP